MNDEYYRQQYRNLNQLYQSNPRMFSADQVDQIEQLGNYVGERFVRDPEAAEFSLMETIKQTASGFVSGFTTIQIGDAPENNVEAIARNVGSLMGFLGYVPGLGMGTKFMATTIARTSMGIGKAIGKGSSFARMGVKAAEGVHRANNITSIPMMVGNKVANKVTRGLTSDGASQATKFLSKKARERLNDSIVEAVRLGTASATSSWQGGVDEMVKGFSMGALEGGVFRGISNFEELGKLVAGADGKMAKQANTAIRMISSSLYGGGLSAAYGDPWEMQIYHYLMGAYFGKTDLPLSQRKAMDFLNKIQTDGSSNIPRRERLLDPRKQEGWEELNQAVKDEVVNQIGMRFGRDSKLNGSKIAEVIKASEAGKLLVESLPKTEEFKNYMFDQEFYKRFNRYSQEMDYEDAYFKAVDDMDGWEVGDLTIDEPKPYMDLTRMDIARGNEEGSNLTYKDMITAAAEEHQIPPVLVSPLEQAGQTIARAQGSGTETREVMRIVGETASDIIKQGGRYDAFADMIKLRTGYEITPDSELDRSLRKSWVQMEQNEVKPQFIYDPNQAGGKGVPFRAVRTTLSDGTKVAETKSVSHLESVLGEGGVAVVKKTDDLDGNTQDLYEYFLDGGETPNPRLLNQYLYESVVQGKPFLAGNKDKGTLLHSTKGWLFDDATYRGDLAGRIRELQKIDSDFLKHHLKARKEFSESIPKSARHEGYQPSVVYDKMVLNNMKMLEELNGLSIQEMARANEASGQELFVLSAPAINKRMQPIADGNPHMRPEDFGDFLKLQPRPVSEREAEPIEIGRPIEEVGEVAAGETPESGLYPANLQDGKLYIGAEGDIHATLMDRHNMNIETTERGFVSTEGRWLNRNEASEYTKKAKIATEGDGPDGMLMADQLKGEAPREPAEAPKGLHALILNGNPKDIEGIEYSKITVKDQKTGEVRKIDAEQVSDGIVYVHPTAYNLIAQRAGNPAESGFQKATIVGKDEANGMLVGKFGMFKAPEEVVRLMEQQGASLLMYDTAVKQLGFRKKYDFSVDKDGNTLLFEEGTSNSVGQAETYTVRPEDIRVNLGVYEKRPEDTKIVKQFLLNLESDAARTRFFEEHIAPSIFGEERTNILVSNRNDISKRQLAQINVDNMGLSQIMQVLTEPSHVSLNGGELYSKVLRHVLNENMRVDSIDPADYKDALNIDQIFEQAGVDSFNGSGDRIVKVASELDILTPAIANMQNTSRYIEGALRKYLMNRIVRPQIKYSGKSILYGQDAYLHRRNGGKISDGTFQFADGLKDKKIRWLDGEEVTLKEAWDEYRVAKEAGDERLKEMETLLEFSIIRVPADSASGTRQLRFGGFSGREGYGIHVNADDMTNLGGADNDGDSVFFYQNIDGNTERTPIADDIRRHADQWRNPDGTLLDSKAHEDLPYSEGGYKIRRDTDKQGLYGAMNPYSLLETHMGSTLGNQMLGPAANMAGYMSAFRTAWMRGDEGARFIRANRRGNEIEIEITGIDTSLREAMKWRREYMNAAADATQPLLVNKSNVGKLISDRVITDFEVRVNGEPVTGSAKENFRDLLDIRNTDVVERVASVNRITKGKLPSARKRELEEMGPHMDVTETASMWQTLEGLQQFTNQNTHNNRLKSTGNLFYDALMRGGLELKDSWRKTRYEGYGDDGSSGDRKSLFAIAPYVNRDAEVIQNYVNRFFRDQHTLAVLKNSGLNSFQIGTAKERTDIRYRNHWEFENDMKNLTSLMVNHMTAKKALEAGTSGQQLAGIRSHVDSFKYNYNKLSSQGDYAQDRNFVLKEGKLGWRKDGRPIEEVDELIRRTEEYAEKLSPEEKAYYDAYMMGSLSEQRFSKDEIARFEYIKASEGLKTYSQVREALAKRPELASKYEHVNFDFIAGDIWKIPNKKERNRMLRLRNEIERVYQNKNSTNVGFTLSHIDSSSLGNFLKVYNGFTQNTPGKKRVFREITHPESSVILRDALLAGLDDEARDRFDEEFARAEPENSNKSLQRYFERHDSNRPVESVADAESASEQGIYRKSEYGNQFYELYRRMYNEENGAEVNMDASTPEGKRNRELVHRMQNVWKEMPDHISKYALEVFEGATGVTPQRATLDDLEGFINYMTQFKRKTFLERSADALGGFRNLPDGVKWYHWLFMPDTIARRMGEFDINLSQPEQRPVYTTEGVVTKEVREVFSTFEMVRRVLSAAEEQHSAITALNAQRMDEELGFLNAETIIDDKSDLIEVAIAQREAYEVMQELQRRQANGDVPEGHYDYAINVYKKEAKKVEEVFDRVKDKRYSYKDPDTGETVTVTGRELVGYHTKGGEYEQGKINEAFTRLNEFVANTYINPDGADQFIVRNPDGSMDAMATVRRLGEQFQGTTRDDERIANIGLNNMYELANELSYLHNYTTEYGGEFVKVKDIPNGDHRREILQNLRLRDRGYPDGDGGYMKHPDGTYKLRDPIQLMNKKGYFPHMNHTEKAVEDHIREFYADESGLVDAEKALKLKRWHAEGKLEDAGMSKPYIEALFSELKAKSTRDISIDRPYGNLSARSDTAPLGGWERTQRAYESYMNALSKSYHNLFGVVNGQQLSRNFRQRSRLGDMTESWAKFLDIQIQDFTGQPSTFPSHYFQDAGLNLKRSPYYALSDHNAEELYHSISEKMGLLEEGDEGARTERGLQFQQKLKNLSILEGKYSLMTLLANTRSMVNNYVGGTSMTAISSGWNPFRRASSLSYIRNNIDPSLKTWEDVQRFAIKHGAVESWIQHEVAPTGQLKGNTKRFAKELQQKLLDDPRASEMSIKEIARRNGMTDALTEGAAWFMRRVERELRVKSWMAHYIKARDTLLASRGEGAVKVDDPWLIDMAQKGVWGTQFLYNNANRPAIARTNLGRVFTRFQLWSWNSVKFRRDVTGEAMRAGFKKDSPEFKKFQRMAQADLFMFALAAAFPMSMFESVIPSPWNYLEDFSDYFFGDPDERDKAFFGTIPYPFNPVQVALPPASRIPFAGINAAIAMLSDESLDNFLNYQIYSLIPFGLVTRNVYKSAKNPAMSVDFMTGVPIHRMNRQIQKYTEDQRFGSYGLYQTQDDADAATPIQASVPVERR